MSSSATGVGMPICFLGAILLILTQKSSQKFGDVLGIFYCFVPSLYNIGENHINTATEVKLLGFWLVLNEEISQRKRLKQWVTNHPKIIWRIRTNGSQHINSLSEPPFMSIEISLNNISNNHNTNYYNYSDSFRKCISKSF